MKAIVAEPPKKNSVKLVKLHKPIPKQGEVLLRTQCVGIDGTDREIDEGIYGTPPEGADYIVLGHETTARVQEIGERVLGFSEGDLVVPTVRRPCEENCLNCRVGETDMCLTGNYFEHGIYRLHGFASEYAVSDADFLVTIPSKLEDLAYLILTPFFVRAFALSVYSKHINEKIGSRLNRLLQSAGPIVGTFFGLLLVANKTQLFLVFSMTMGLILYIVIRDMIPIGKEGKPIYFMAGALITIATSLIFHPA